MAWIKALRGRKYKQGMGYLEREGGKYCCLGVLCRVAANMGIYDPLIRHDDRLYGSSLECQADIQIFGVTLNQQQKLISMNDIRRSSFRTIANWIYRNMKSR